MVNTTVLKIRAKEKLKGIYSRCIIGALVCMIPNYLISMLNGIFAVSGAATGIVTFIFPQILQITVTEVFTVGYIRSLMNVNSENEEKKYDINDVLSGYRLDFGNTVKVLLVRYLYKLGWAFIIALPFAVGVSVYFVTTPLQSIKDLYGLILGFTESFSGEMLVNICNHILTGNKYAEYIFAGACVVSVILFIPYVRRLYEYMMIPMILAEDPSRQVKEVFGYAHKVMNGYRMKYFVLQLSFLGIFFLAAIAMSFAPSMVFVYIPAALIFPYVFMTFLEFYLVRTERLCYNKDMLNERVDTNEN